MIYTIIYFNKPKIHNSYNDNKTITRIDNFTIELDNNNSKTVLIKEGKNQYSFLKEEIQAIVNKQIYKPLKVFFSRNDLKEYGNLFYVVSPLALLLLNITGDVFIDTNHLIYINKNTQSIMKKIFDSEGKLKLISKIRNNKMNIDFDFAIISLSNEEILTKTNIDLDQK